VTVRDAGVGIERQGIDQKLFDAFYTTKSDGHGYRAVCQPFESSRDMAAVSGWSRMMDQAATSRFLFPAIQNARLDRGLSMSPLGLVFLGAVAVIVGALIPIQAATNAAMSRAIGSVTITSVVLFAIGFLVVAAWQLSFANLLPSR